jgi:protein involved in polysaccharide export with SLBB domain
MAFASETSERVQRRPLLSIGRIATESWVGRVLLFAAQLFAIINLVSCASKISDSERASTPNRAYDSTAKLPGWIADNHSDCSSPSPIRTLREHRAEQGDSYNFPVGPGDVLHIQVADLKEFEHLTVRVDGDGTIGLPLAGNMVVAGMNEDQVRQAISDRVSDYIIHPRVHVFISQYYSRSVAVMGMVAKPGTYSLAGPSESILDIIGRAGGMREGAAQRVVFFPVETNINAVSRDVSSYRKVACADESNGRDDAFDESRDCPAPSPNLAAAAASGDTLVLSKEVSKTEGSTIMSKTKGSTIIIDLAKPAFAGCLDIPARPGDVVLIPPAGQVGVYGWVQKPGTFDVTPGMTALGAVTAAGGAMFSSKGEILRTLPDGQRTIVPINLSSVEKGGQRDIPVEAGDLVLVRASALGAVPYAFSTLLGKFGTGMYFPVP